MHDREWRTTYCRDEELEKGGKEANEATVHNLKKLGISIPIIMDATGLSAEEIKKSYNPKTHQHDRKAKSRPAFLEPK